MAQSASSAAIPAEPEFAAASLAASASRSVRTESSWSASASVGSWTNAPWAGLEIDPALGVQALEGLTYGLAGDPEMAGEFALHQMLPGPQGAHGDEFEQRLVDTLAQRAGAFELGHGALWQSCGQHAVPILAGYGNGRGNGTTIGYRLQSTENRSGQGQRMTCPA